VNRLLRRGSRSAKRVRVLSNGEWRRRSHDKIVNNHVTSVDGKPWSESHRNSSPQRDGVRAGRRSAG
jgi:hypothetical protein